MKTMAETDRERISRLDLDPRVQRELIAFAEKVDAAIERLSIIELQLGLSDRQEEH